LLTITVKRKSVLIKEQKATCSRKFRWLDVDADTILLTLTGGKPWHQKKSVMKGALEAASEFFELSTEHKEMFASADIQQPIRYDTSSRDGISTARSLLKHCANPLEDWVQFWPINPPTYR